MKHKKNPSKGDLARAAIGALALKKIADLALKKTVFTKEQSEQASRPVSESVYDTALKLTESYKDASPLAISQTTPKEIADQVVEQLSQDSSLYPGYIPAYPVYPDSQIVYISSGKKHRHGHHGPRRSVVPARTSSLVSAPRRSFPSDRSTITGGGRTEGLEGLGDANEMVSQAVQTGAEAVDALRQASDESSAYIQQAIVHPEKIQENTKKMTPLGLAFTLYTANWVRKMIF
jgi:hypothetical protein